MFVRAPSRELECGAPRSSADWLRERVKSCDGAPRIDDSLVDYSQKSIWMPEIVTGFNQIPVDNVIFASDLDQFLNNKRIRFISLNIFVRFFDGRKVMSESSLLFCFTKWRTFVKVYTWETCLLLNLCEELFGTRAFNRNNCSSINERWIGCRMRAITKFEISD